MTTSDATTNPAEMILPPSRDPLGEAMHSLRMSGVFYSRAELAAPWGIDLPAMPGCMMFHIVTAGGGLLRVAGEAPRHVEAGTFALVPHGEGHQLVDAPETRATPLFELPCERISERYEVLRAGGGGAATRMVCGAVRLQHPAAEHLVRLLPGMIVVEAGKSLHLDWMLSSLRLIATEAQSLKPGGEAMITRLADILVIQAIRAWIEEDPAAQTGWLGALRDPQIGRALLLIHQHLEEPWSVASLAEAVAMSRSAFAAKFAKLVGDTPVKYVRKWKMQMAVTMMQQDASSVSELAERLGYGSEAAFSRAFKQVMGCSPRAMRRQDDAAATRSSAWP